MNKVISALLVVVFAILAMAVPAQAQMRDPYYNGAYDRSGRYDRYDRGGYNQGMQCQHDRDGRPYNCRRYDGRGGKWVPFVVGAVVGGAVTAIVTSRKNRNEQPNVQQGPYEEPAGVMAPMPQQVVRQEAVNPEDEISWTTVNTTDFPALVTDPNNGKKTLIPRHGSMELSNPSGPKAYEVKLLSPGAGRTDMNPGQIKPSKDFLRWEILALE